MVVNNTRLLKVPTIDQVLNSGNSTDKLLKGDTSPLNLGKNASTSHALTTDDVLFGGKIEVQDKSYYDYSSGTTNDATLDASITSLGLSNPGDVISVYKASLTGNAGDNSDAGIVAFEANLAADVGGANEVALLIKGGFSTGVMAQDQDLRIETLDIGGGGGKVIIESNGSNAIELISGSGSILMRDSVQFNVNGYYPDNVPAIFGTSSDSRLLFSTDQTNDSLLLATDDSSQNFIITKSAWRGRDHDLSDSSTPSLFIFGEDPDVDNTTYISITHNGTNAIFDVGTGEFNFSGNQISCGNFIATTGAFTTIRSYTGDSLRLRSYDGHNIIINSGKTNTDIIMHGGTLDNVFYLDASENRIGMGTNTPAVKLQVIGADANDGIFANNSSANSNLYVGESGGPTGIYGNITWDYTNQRMSLGTAVSGTSYADTMILEDSNVLIGTTTSDGRLTLKGVSADGSDNVLSMLDSSDNNLMEVDTNGVHNYNSGAKVYEDYIDISDETSIALPDATSGYGTVFVGDNEEFARFRWTTAGVVTLDENTANVVITDTDTKFCILDNGTEVILKNRLGSNKNVRYEIHYS